MAERGPLAGVRVLDMSQHVAGPYCAKLLADYGAEVIKIESPGGGDVARRLGPFPGDIPHPEKSGLFLHLNTNKLGITLDVRTRSGQHLLRELLAQSDVIVEDFGSGDLASMGFDARTVHQVNPRAVVASVASFGQGGPYRDYKATDMVLYAMSGWMSLMGRPDRAPLYPGGPYILYLAGQYASIGALLALEYADVHGVGQRVDVSVLEAGVSGLSYDTVAYSYHRAVNRRQGHRKRGLTTSIQPCQDGFITLCVGHGEERWQDLWTVLLQRPDVLEDPRFDVDQRAQHADTLETIAREVLRERTVEEVFHTGQALRLFVAPVPSVKEVLECPQHAARGYFQDMDHPQAGRLTYSGPPARLSETPWKLRMPAPLLGQHNVEVYTERLGLRRETLVALRAEGVI